MHSRSEPRPVPPGQRLVAELPVQHYGRVPTLDEVTWTLTLCGATGSGGRRVLTWADLMALPQVELVADQHCVSKLTQQDVSWRGVRVRDVVELEPPVDGAEHTLVSAEYGYASSVALADLLSPRTLLATHRGGEALTPERGGPVRLVIPHLYGWKGPKWVREIEYHHDPVRGFWEQRGYHLVGDAWRQERYSYQG
ncbi:molybdopterin-dependent oxidoreductase [Arsenicicoccus dermatophilus]|uniref:molybdopterin-dependent oxidoreductase n=1 Tax=Arsenicicoccus dermatophilus TaxID=1076331 RepID=UPI001F4C8471|nr:molybdopterin-dependent oxidoreductase [Arsenicicoccus dermatophilus]MCH8612650.1 molybdopterin-dependent oxidoreductase [Arsenicicoccus dermatophilus]